MRKKEVKKAVDNELIVELANIYSVFVLNYYDENRDGIKHLSKKLEWLTDEMVKRGLITEAQQHRLMSE